MANVQQLIQRQVNRYELISRIFTPKKRRIRPVITFSREPGSGGRLIAQLVSRKLGFEYYDRNLIDLISRHSGMEKEIVVNLDEQKENNLTAIIRRLFGREPLPQQAYIRALSHTILAIAEKGSAVIVGRGANFIIPADKHLSVRVIAPLKVRIKSNLTYDGQTEEEAREDIKKIHFNRKNYVKKYFSKNISSANYYDLVINTKSLSLENAAESVIALYQDCFRL